MEPNSHSFQNYETEAPFAASYPKHKQNNLTVARCRFEKIEYSRHVGELVSTFQNKARNDPDYFTDNNSSLLVYWEDDKVWYHCKVISYDREVEKFNLEYDDGVLESVSLWKETFITYDQLPQRRNEITTAGYYEGNGQMYMHGPRKVTSRRKGQDHSRSKVGKEVHREVVDKFLIVEKEYITSRDDSSISSEDMQYEEEDERMQYGNQYMVNQGDGRRAYMGAPAEAAGDDQYHQDIMHSSSRHPSVKHQYNSHMMESARGDYNHAKMYKRGEEMDERMQESRAEETQVQAKKVGPFETTKSQSSRSQGMTDAMSVERKETEQIYTPNNFNTLFGTHQQPSSEAYGNPMVSFNSQRNPERDIMMQGGPSREDHMISPEMIKTLRQNNMLPSAGRIIKDMKAYEKRFYERFLSSGYKLCECQV